MTTSPANHHSHGHHYVFAHRALPAVFFERPQLTMIQLVVPEEDGTTFLESFWEFVGTRLDEPPMSGAALRQETIRHGDDFIAVITLPPPQQMAEAFMVALVVQTDDGNLQPEAEGGPHPGGPRCHYFTLELGVAEDFETPRTVLCGWENNKHLNYGDGPPEPTIEAFVAAIYALLSEEDEPS